MKVIKVLEKKFFYWISNHTHKIGEKFFLSYLESKYPLKYLHFTVKRIAKHKIMYKLKYSSSWRGKKEKETTGLPQSCHIHGNKCLQGVQIKAVNVLLGLLILDQKLPNKLINIIWLWSCLSLCCFSNFFKNSAI